MTDEFLRVAGPVQITRVTEIPGCGPQPEIDATVFDMLDALAAQVRGINGSNGAIYVNVALRARIESGFRRLGGAELLMEVIAGKRTAAWRAPCSWTPGRLLPG
ncbi:hypothetical protein QZH56_32220 [Streptomyces olivoreticuli]|uniref:hypothetical protein n=1 Tax=Streptomyces olivoreticuli TaxID=68246 RepID=UPI002657F51B|nr:hypothetical protein [Streptomyces olivoreticuli]WKK23352.1 hypothetical protein QZH56_32220 [Streptomyces olivoreticuli]